MSDLDALLQEKLAALENGEPLEAVLADLPAEAEELAELLQLATAVRSLPHPMPVNAQVAAQRQHVMAAAEVHTQPLRQAETKTQRRSVPVMPAKKIRWPALPVFGGGAAAGFIGAFALVLVLLVGLGMWLGGSSLDTVRAENVSGWVEVASSDTAEDWKTLKEGARLESGQRVRTIGASGVTLVFSEGSRTYLGPNSDLTLSKVDGGAGKTIHAELTQNSGETNHRVVPFEGKKSSFLVHTPSGTASVHGTSFVVKVHKGGTAQVMVNTGEVRVMNVNAEVTLLAGQGTAVEPGSAPAAPSYLFTVQGSLLDNEGDTWTVSGVSFLVTDQTNTSEELALGDTVQVIGRVLATGTRVADSIELAEDTTQTASFTGIIEAMNGDFWQVGGQAVIVDSNTSLDENLEIGQTVKVTYNTLSDGSYLALSIEALVEEPPVEPTETPTELTPTAEVTETPTITETVTETPEVTETPAVTETPDASPTPDLTATAVTPEVTPTVSVTPCLEDCTCTANGQKQHPTGLTLAQRYGVPYEEIMTWFCQGYGFGEIDLAYSLASVAGLDVEEVFELRASGLGWGQIKKQLDPDKEAKDNNGRGKGKDKDQDDDQNFDDDQDDRNDQGDRDNGNGNGKNKNKNKNNNNGNGNGKGNKKGNKP